MDQHEPGVDQVEWAIRGRADRHVVLDDLDLGGHHTGRPGQVDVGGEDAARRADPLGEVRHHRRPSRTHLPAAPTRREADGVEMPEGRGVEEERERREAIHRLGGVVGEEVPALAHGLAGSGVGVGGGGGGGGGATRSCEVPV